MIALREIRDVTSGAVTIALPADFHAKRVEIIVLPIEEPATQVENFQELLLKAPTLTEEELQEFDEIREWMNQWSVKEF